MDENVLMSSVAKNFWFFLRVKIHSNSVFLLFTLNEYSNKSDFRLIMKDYDFKELERVTNYEDYTSDSPVIKNFWAVVHSMTTEQQRQLLQFATGSDRIPVGGMSKMKFTIARQGADADR